MTRVVALPCSNASSSRFNAGIVTAICASIRLEPGFASTYRIYALLRAPLLENLNHQIRPKVVVTPEEHRKRFRAMIGVTSMVRAVAFERNEIRMVSFSRDVMFRV